MFKKIAKGLVIGGAVLGMMAGTAMADDMDINIYGASAQHKFWLKLAPSYLDAKGCDTVTTVDYNKKHGMAVGTNCDFTATDADTITIRYSSLASYDGVNAVLGVDPDATCGSGYGNYRMMTEDASTLACKQVNLGASDVASESFVQSTTGWDNGDLGYSSGGTYKSYNASTLNFGADASSLSEFNPIVVPFGFMVSNTVKEYRCTYPEQVGEEKAYDKYGRHCVPSEYLDHCEDGSGDILFADGNGDLYEEDTCEDDGYTWVSATTTVTGGSGPSTECVGYFPCLDSTCAGGPNVGDSCTYAEDCPDVLPSNIATSTMCQEMPVQNITQAMAQSLFGKRTSSVSTGESYVDDWSDFGPSFPAEEVVLCMRHAGSGTHATFDFEVMEGDYVDGAYNMEKVAIQGDSHPIVSGVYPTEVWHFKSSSTLSECVNRLPGAIGYVDSDKLITLKELGAYDGAHMVSYNGAEATRDNIVNGNYEFWAAQHVYYTTTDFPTGSNLEALRADMETFSSDPDNLTFSPQNKYWAAQSEMKVIREWDGGPILRKVSGE